MVLNFQSMDDFKAELMKDPEFKKEYEETKPYYEIATIIITLRSKAGLTQGELAEKIGTTQSRISAWENGNTRGMKIETLKKIVEATNYKMILTFQEDKKKFNDDNYILAFGI